MKQNYIEKQRDARLSTQEIDKVTLVLTLDDAVCISDNAHTLTEGMHITILHSTIGK